MQCDHFCLSDDGFAQRKFQFVLPMVGCSTYGISPFRLTSFMISRAPYPAHTTSSTTLPVPAKLFADGMADRGLPPV